MKFFMFSADVYQQFLSPLSAWLLRLECMYELTEPLPNFSKLSTMLPKIRSVIIFVILSLVCVLLLISKGSEKGVISKNRCSSWCYFFYLRSKITMHEIPKTWAPAKFWYFLLLMFFMISWVRWAYKIKLSMYQYWENWGWKVHFLALSSGGM